VVLVCCAFVEAHVACHNDFVVAWDEYFPSTLIATDADVESSFGYLGQFAVPHGLVYEGVA
jgi:hypothetical protein